MKVSKLWLRKFTNDELNSGCTCGHAAMKHSTVGFPIDYPKARCTVRRHIIFKCPCSAYDPVKKG